MAVAAGVVSAMRTSHSVMRSCAARLIDSGVASLVWHAVNVPCLVTTSSRSRTEHEEPTADSDRFDRGRLRRSEPRRLRTTRRCRAPRRCRAVRSSRGVEPAHAVDEHDDVGGLHLRGRTDAAPTKGRGHFDLHVGLLLGVHELRFEARSVRRIPRVNREAHGRNPFREACSAEVTWNNAAQRRHRSSRSTPAGSIRVRVTRYRETGTRSASAGTVRDDPDHGPDVPSASIVPATVSSASASRVPKPSSRKIASSLLPPRLPRARRVGRSGRARGRATPGRSRRRTACAPTEARLGVAVVDDDELVLVARSKRVAPRRKCVQRAEAEARAHRWLRRAATSRSGPSASASRAVRRPRTPHGRRGSRSRASSRGSMASSICCSPVRASWPCSSTASQ